MFKWLQLKVLHTKEKKVYVRLTIPTFFETNIPIKNCYTIKLILSLSHKMFKILKEN